MAIAIAKGEIMKLFLLAVLKKFFFDQRYEERDRFVEENKFTLEMRKWCEEEIAKRNKEIENARRLG
jgi:hypothetical protein